MVVSAVEDCWAVWKLCLF